MDITTTAISEIAFEQVCRMTKGMSKETYAKMIEMQKKLKEYDYDRQFFY